MLQRNSYTHFDSPCKQITLQNISTKGPSEQTIHWIGGDNETHDLMKADYPTTKCDEVPT